jgi:hypothetical protein
MSGSAFGKVLGIVVRVDPLDLLLAHCEFIGAMNFFIG